MISYVLVADSNGEIEILQVAYETKWKDLCIMLQLKFDYESLPIFTYTDDEEDIVCLDSQDALDEALKVCQRSDDVLHVQIRSNGAPPRPVQRSPPIQNEPQKPVIISRDRIEMARAAMGNTIGWATSAVKSAFSRSVSTDPVSEDTCKKNPPVNSDLSMEGVNVPEETESEPILHEVDQSFQTNVKEVMESELYDISVPTTTMYDTDEESEVIVKEPIASTSEQTYGNQQQIDPVMLQSIREEVRSVLAQELQTFRNEVSAGLTQSMTSKQFEDGDNPSTSRDVVDRPRSPTTIKADIRKLKIEMKEAKQVRKIEKQNEKSLKKRSVDTEMMIPPVLSPKNETKKVRKYAASFICENLSDGSFVGVGQQFVKYWVLKNEGTITWDDHIQLKLVDEKLTEDSSSVDPESEDENRIIPVMVEKQYGPEKLSLGMPIVESGNTAVLAVTHVAPTTPCLYTSAWRLCHSDKFFGPRIWCKVAVRRHIENHPQIIADESLSLFEQGSEQSYVSKSWEPTRKISTEEHIGADDDLSNMLSFEMTAVGDFNKETSGVEHQNNNFNFQVSYPPHNIETPTEITEAEVMAAQNQTEAVEQLETTAEEQSEIPAEKSLAHTEMVDEPERLDEPAKTLMVVEDNEDDINFHSIPSPEEIPEEIPMIEEEDNPEDLEVEEKEEYHDVDDTHSDVPSDFEVIPLPECFDTSKPLNSLEKSEEETAEDAGNDFSNLSTHALDVEEDEDEFLPPPPPSFVQVVSKEEAIEIDSDEEEVSEELQTEELASNFLPTTSQSSSDKSIAPACLPVPQSVLDMNKPASSAMVQDYSTGYQTPAQKTAPSQDPWIPQPIPLPRGVLDADKAWSKNETAPKTTIPLPRPRGSAHSQEQDRDVASEMQYAHTDSPSLQVVEDVDSPQICFPPSQEAEDADEFTLAPEVLMDSPPLAVLVPPGYPVPPPEIPSLVAQPTIPAPALDPPAPYNPSPMEQLVDMGFLNIELNEDILKEFEGDVTKAVHALVYRGREDRPRRRGLAGRLGFLA